MLNFPQSRTTALQAMATEWSRDPTDDQQRFYELLGDVYAYEPNTSRGLLILRRKVGYAICGLPDEESKCDNAHTGYTEKKYKTIKDVVDIIIEVNKRKRKGREQLHMAIVFVSIEHEKQLLQFPVFRVLLTETTWKFVDTNCRTYSSWQDFLKFNELPKGKLCGPVDGIYSGDSEDKVKLRWDLTPAAKIGKRVINAVDRISGVAAVGATGLSLLGLFTPLGPVAAAVSLCGTASGLYTAIRTGTALADRGIHGQSVNPIRNRQAALSWLSMAGSAVGVAAGAVTSRAANLARSGRVMGRGGRVACNALNVASLAVNATGIGIGAFSLRERIKGREATPLEVLQFSSSILFFAHATVNFQTAAKIIQNAQQGVIEDFEKSLRSNRHKKQFQKLAKDTAATGKNVVDGNAKVIRGIRSIENKDDFFAGMLTMRKDSGHDAIFAENGNIIVSGGREIPPMKLCELGKQQRREFISAAEQASQGNISYAILKARFDLVLSSNAAGSRGMSTSLASVATEAVTVLASRLQQGIKGISLGRNEMVLILSVVDELTASVCSTTGREYVKQWWLIWHRVGNLISEMCGTYNEARNVERQIRNFVDKGRFNLKDGIQMTHVFVDSVCKVYKRYKDHIEELVNDIEKLKTIYECCPLCKQAI